MQQKVGFAVIGCGRMGLRRIGLISNHPLAELRCIEDCDTEIVRKTAEQLKCDYCVGWENIINRTDVNCLVVSVPNKYHHDIVIASLEAGKHVFCEKPLARNPLEAGNIVKAAVRTGCYVKVGSNLRYFPSVIKAKQILDSNDIGEIIFARGWIGHSGWQVGTWYSDSEIIGGGTLLDNGCHLLDIYRWFFGEVESCLGLVSTNLWPIAPLEDNAMALFTFIKGVKAYLQASWTEWAGYMYLEIYGSRGLIRIDNRGTNCVTTLIGKDGQSMSFDYSKELPQSYILEFDDFMNCLISNNQPVPSGYDGMRAVQMAHAVYESAQLKKEVEIVQKQVKEVAI